MPLQATPMGSIDGVFTSAEGSEIHLTVVAFVWNDAIIPPVAAGYWVHGVDLGGPGVHFLPADRLRSLA
jgi:hypothetical protein